MTGIPLLIVFCLAIILMIVAISKFHIHPFLSLMGTSLVLAVVVGLPLEKIPGIIGSGFSGVFSSIGIVIILGALIGHILEKTGAAIRLAAVVIRCVGASLPQLAMLLMGFSSFNDPLQALLPAAIYLGLHTLEGQIVTPIVLGKRMALSPLILILALMVFGWMWGLIGLLLAVPLLVCVKIVLTRLDGMEGWAKLLE